MTRPDVEVMRALLERVKAATGPDTPLDQRLFAQEYGWSYPLHGAALYEFRRLQDLGRYTASIDAALALVKRALPGAMWAVGEMEGGPFCRLVYPKSDGFREAVSMEQEGGPDSAPLAICACVLTALIAAEDQARG